MQELKELISNDVLICSIAAWAIAQIFKVFTNLYVVRVFDLKRLVGDGGMPSAHSATVIALSAMTGWIAGFDSVVFAVTMMFSIIVMRDALGVRREAGKHAASIRDIADALNKGFLSKDSEIRTENIKLLVGHTPLQVLLGALVGIIVAVCYILIFMI